MTYAYKNTVGDDLWACLSKACGKDVGAFMNTWILQPGYPLLSVETNSLSQEQFFIGEHAESTRIWPILLSAAPAGSTPEIMYDKHLSTAVTLDQRFNANDTGHFITKYSDAHLNQLLSTIHQAPTIDRLTLLNDQTLLVRGRYKTSASLIDLLPFYVHETNDAVWDIVAMTLGELKKFVEVDAEAEQKLRQLSGTIARNTFERLGFDTIEGESVTDTKLRGTVLGMMLYGEDAAVVKDALARYNPSELTELPSETRTLIMGSAVRYATDDTVVNQLVDIYAHSPLAELKEEIVSAATSTRSVDIAAKLLENCKNSEIVRPQDVAHWFIYIMYNRFTRNVAWDWLRSNWEWILETYAGDKSFDEFPRYAAGGIVTHQQLAEYKDFFTPMLVDVALKRTIEMGISEISARLELLDSDGEDVRSKLRAI